MGARCIPEAHHSSQTQVLRPKKDFRGEPHTLKDELQAQEQTCISIAMDKIKDKIKSKTSVVLANDFSSVA